MDFLSACVLIVIVCISAALSGFQTLRFTDYLGKKLELEADFYRELLQTFRDLVPRK